jgi:tRNA(Arg) A34 adenosine deaminase TadA
MMCMGAAISFYIGEIVYALESKSTERLILHRLI